MTTPPLFPDLLVAILTHNGASMLGASLPIVRASVPNEYRIVVIDNGSTDATASVVSSHTGVDMIATGANLSPGSAFNHLLATVSPESAVVRLDDDVVPLPGWFDGLLDGARAADTGVAGGTLLSADGQLQHLGGDARHPEDPEFERWCIHSNTQERPSGTSAWVSGACMLLTPAARALVPRFDEQFGFWFEDIDYCFSVRSCGLHVRHIREAEVYHLSTGNAIAAPIVQDSHSRFLSKWRSSVHLWGM